MTRNTLRQLIALLCLGSIPFAGGCGTVPKSDAAIPTAPEPSRVEPVTAAIGLDRPSVPAGKSFEIVVQVRIAGGYHIYGTGSVAGPFLPTTLTLELPEELKPAGDWIVPHPTVTRSGEKIYTDSLLFRRRVQVRLNAPEKMLSIKGELQFQACEEELCRPPAKIALSASVAVVSK